MGMSKHEIEIHLITTALNLRARDIEDKKPGDAAVLRNVIGDISLIDLKDIDPPANMPALMFESKAGLIKIIERLGRELAEVKNTQGQLESQLIQSEPLQAVQTFQESNFGAWVNDLVIGLSRAQEFQYLSQKDARKIFSKEISKVGYALGE